LAAACRKVSRHAAVVWWKRKLFQRTGTQEICGRRKELAIAGIRKTRRASVAWGKEYFVRIDWARNQVNVGQEIKKRQKDGKRLRKRPECNSGLRNAFLSQQLRDPDTCRQLRLRIKKTSNEIFGEKIAKRVVGISCRLQRIKKRTLWRGRPPPKRKKRLHTE
jgi:hypothetical protein